MDQLVRNNALSILSDPAYRNNNDRDLVEGLISTLHMSKIYSHLSVGDLYEVHHRMYSTPYESASTSVEVNDIENTMYWLQQLDEKGRGHIVRKIIYNNVLATPDLILDLAHKRYIDTLSLSSLVSSSIEGVNIDVVMEVFRSINLKEEDLEHHKWLLSELLDMIQREDRDDLFRIFINILLTLVGYRDSMQNMLDTYPFVLFDEYMTPLTWRFGQIMEQEYDFTVFHNDYECRDEYESDRTNSRTDVRYEYDEDDAIDYVYQGASQDGLTSILRKFTREEDQCSYNYLINVGAEPDGSVMNAALMNNNVNLAVHLYQNMNIDISEDSIGRVLRSGSMDAVDYAISILGVTPKMLIGEDEYTIKALVDIWNPSDDELTSLIGSLKEERDSIFYLPKESDYRNYEDYRRKANREEEEEKEMYNEIIDVLNEILKSRQ